MKTILYHGSKTKIEKFDDSRPMYFSSYSRDAFLALNSFFLEPVKRKGYIYIIEVETESIPRTSEFMPFHSGEILSNGLEAAKMESTEMDNNWYCFLNVNKFRPMLVKVVNC